MEYKITLRTLNSMQHGKPSHNANVGNNSKFHVQSDIRFRSIYYFIIIMHYAVSTRIFVYSEVWTKGVDLSNAFIFDLFKSPAVQE